MALAGRSKTGIITVPVGAGIVVDEVAHEVGDGFGTSALNVRFRDGYLRKTEGHRSVLTAIPADAQHVATYQNISKNWWVTVTTSAIYADDGATQTNITGSALTGALTSKVTSCVLGGVLIVNNGTDIPQYWGGTGTAGNLSAWDTTWRCKSLRSFKNYLIALNVTKGTTNYGSMVKWSHAAAPGFLPDSWDEADPTRDAGENDVAETDDYIVDGLPLGNTFIVYKQRSAYGMQFVPSNDIFRFFRLPGNFGALSQNCVADTPNGHVVLTNGPDLVLHYANEPKSLLDGRWRLWLQANIDPNNFGQAFVFHNPAKYEVWACFPYTGSTYCDRALIWNYQQDAISMVEIPNLTHAAIGQYLASSEAWSADSAAWSSDSTPWDAFDVGTRVIASSTNSLLYLIDEGDDFNGSPISATWEKTGLTFGDADLIKRMLSVTLRVDAAPGTVLSVYAGTTNDVEGSYTWSSAVTYTVGTTRKADFIITGRFLALRITSAAAGAWRIKSVGFDVKPEGYY